MVSGRRVMRRYIRTKDAARVPARHGAALTRASKRREKTKSEPAGLIRPRLSESASFSTSPSRATHVRYAAPLGAIATARGNYARELRCSFG